MEVNQPRDACLFKQTFAFENYLELTENDSGQ